MKKEIRKELITTVIAKGIYYTITSTVMVSAILLIIGILGAVVEIAVNNAVFMTCLLVVFGYVIMRFIIQEVNRWSKLYLH